MSEYTIKTDVFEGPLDLLLHLIQKLEINIYDIPVAVITSQYMEYIRTIKLLELDVAGEYLVMAATLMAIKSKMLLPNQEIDSEIVEEGLPEEGPDPRDELVEQLLEYRKYKEAAAVLKAKETERGQYFTKEPANLEQYQKSVPLEPLQVSTFDLIAAFKEMMEKQKKRIPLQTTVAAEEVSILDKISMIEEMVKSAKQGQGILFSDFFIPAEKKEMITSFLAMLELIKEKKIVIRQDFLFGDILVFSSDVNSAGEVDYE